MDVQWLPMNVISMSNWQPVVNVQWLLPSNVQWLLPMNVPLHVAWLPMNVPRQSVNVPWLPLNLSERAMGAAHERAVYGATKS